MGLGVRLQALLGGALAVRQPGFLEIAPSAAVPSAVPALEATVPDVVVPDAAVPGMIAPAVAAPAASEAVPPPPALHVQKASASQEAEQLKVAKEEAANALEQQISLQSEQQAMATQLSDVRAELKQAREQATRAEQMKAAYAAQNLKLNQVLSQDQAQIVQQKQALTVDTATLNELQGQVTAMRADRARYEALLGQLTALAQRAQAVTGIAQTALAKSSHAEELAMGTSQNFATAVQSVMAIQRRVDANKSLLTRLVDDSKNTTARLEWTSEALEKARDRMEGMDETVALIGTDGMKMANEIARMEKEFAPLASRVETVLADLQKAGDSMHLIRGQVDAGVNTAIQIHVQQLMSELRQQIRAEQDNLSRRVTPTA